MTRFLPALVGALCALLLPAPIAHADVEPNDIPEHGELVTGIPSTTTGTFVRPDDADVYVLYVGTAGTRIRARATIAGTACDPACTVSLRLKDLSGLWGKYDGQFGTRSTPIIEADLDVAVRTPGTYFLRVEGYHVSSATHPYTLEIDVDQPLLNFPPEQCAAARVARERAETGLARALRSERRWAGAVRARRAYARTLARRRLAEARRHVHFHRDRIAAATETLRLRCGEL